MLGIAEYFWRLIPANPILLRVVQMNGKRRRDLFIRCGYLGLLIAVVLFSISGASSGNLSELAKTSSTLFQSLSNLQLGLVALLAPIFTAAAITQERDSQTYDILLATPLSNGQIVLGSLLSRLFFVVALLISGVPIFSITQIFGGVAISAIVQSFLIAAATALVTGAVAMAIAVLKVGTRRTIFSFYMFIVIYLLGTYVLDQVPAFKFSVFSPTNNRFEPSTTGWLTGLNPFLALKTIFHDKAYMPPSLGDLPPELQRWPVGWYLSNPATFYITFMFLISFVLILPSVLLLRRLAQSTVSMQTAVLQKLGVTRGDRTRKPRIVWSNPIAWREAKTKASAARSIVMRYGFIILGIGGALLILFLFTMRVPPKSPTYITSTSYNPVLNQLTVYSSLDVSAKPKPLAPDFSATYTDESAFDASGAPIRGASITMSQLMANVAQNPVSVVATAAKAPDGTELQWSTIAATVTQRRLSAPEARQALLGACVVEFAVILLIVTNAAASTVTREKEDGTLDLLLSSPITSRYYIWGKLRGLVSFALPLLAVPLLSVAFFVIYDFFRMLRNWDAPSSEWIVFPEALVLLPGMLIIVVAFAAILGMNMSLRLRKTVTAVMCSIGIVAGICTAMSFCGFTVASKDAGFAGPVAVAGSPFTLLTILIAPDLLNHNLIIGDDAASNRVIVVVVAFIAIGIYTAVVFAMYRSMVKNFDMTIRKQSR